MLKVAHSIPVWLPLTMSWLNTQVKYLPSSQIESRIICENSENLQFFPHANIHCLRDGFKLVYHWDRKLRKLGLRQHLHHLVKICQKYDIQILHSHFGDVAWRNLDAVKKLGIKHIVTFYGYDVNMLINIEPQWKERYLRLFQEADCFLCEGSYMASCLIKLGCPADKIKVHHLGVETEKIAYCPRQWQKSEPLKILISASFREKKGIPYALEALGRLQHEIPLSITIIGDAFAQERDQLEKQRILQVVERYQLHSIIRFLGFQPHDVFLTQAYQHHLFISPSVTAADGDTEGGAPVSLTEMAASGMPIVSSFHCDIPNVIKHKETGFLAKEKDIDGIVEGIYWWLNQEDLWQQTLNRSRDYVEKYYNAKIQGGQLASIYGLLI